MKIAVIGAGFAGLAVSYFLCKSASVDLFDEKGVGGGASGIACGLVHPYPGEDARRSWNAQEALMDARALFAHVPGCILNEGVMRVGRTPEKNAFLRDAFSSFDDVEEKEGYFFIKSGMTIDVPFYLRGLFIHLQQHGVKFVQQKITNLQELGSYDKVVVAAGAGICDFFPDLPLELLKGQLLWGKGDIILKHSLISKGYIALAQGGYFLGATYERNFSSALPDQAFALSEILPKITTFFPDASQLKIEECKAGIRVMRKGHYIPIIQRKSPNTWVFTALGSRGLLYHAHMGKLLAQEVLFG